MLTTKAGKKNIPIARIEGGKFNKKVIFVDVDKKENDEDLPYDQSKLFNSDFGKMSVEQKFSTIFKILKTKRMILDNKKPAREDDIYKEAKKNKDKINGKQLFISDGKVFPMPNDLERSIHYIAGPSGSGKSTYCRFLIQGYRKIFGDDANVYLFSRLSEDPALDDLDVKRIIMDEDLITNPIDIHELKESFVIMDDIDTIPNKKLRDQIFTLKNDISEAGRKLKIYIAITSHQISNYKETRIILNELHTLTVFPGMSTPKQIKYVLTNYFDLNKKQISYVLNVRSRWVTLRKFAPQLLIHEKGIEFLNSI
jgi:hypothetical protein